MKIKTEVLVVGGGPAGATVARFVAGGGREVCLLEKDLNHQKPCGGGMPEALYREFSIGFPERHRKTRFVRIVSPSSREMVIELEGGHLVTVDRREFDQALRQRARQEGALVVEGQFINIKEWGRRSLVVEALVEGQRTLFETRYLVGADGVNSSVRRAAGLKHIKKAYTLSLKTSEMHTEQCQFWFSKEHAPYFYSWVFPSPEGVSTGTGTLEPAMARGLFQRFLQRLNTELPLQDLRGYYIPLWDDYEFYRDGVFFVGDAAGQVMPFTYEGIYYAMKSAEFVAEAILKNRPSLYRALWKKRFYSRFKLMQRISRYFYRSDRRIETLFDIFQNPKVQKASMKLWLEKDTSRGALLSYINIFRRFLK
ncbi:MAG: geranylgeranyl reductase family protein [Nitrospirae bacterium]|nr:MAG: geranylgeranyl reductase family protein [Nitrospirota bacterium]